MLQKPQPPAVEGHAPNAPRAGAPEASEFLLHVCHDMRTALRTIRTRTGLIQRGCQAAQLSGLEEHFSLITEGAERIDRLADGIAAYSIALQIQNRSFQLTPLDVLMRAVLTKLDKDLRANEARVECDKLPRVSGDPDRLMEVFENLLRNALCHRGTNPPVIQVTAEKQPDAWLFAVRDNGPGVEAPYLEYIFQPFARLHGERRAGPGLGLAVVRLIVERHGGRTWAESNSGGGAAFFFTLPAE